MAINREELAALVNYPPDVPLVDTVITPNQRKKKQYPEPVSFNPEEAKNLLEAAGWLDSNGDGIRDRDGRDFKFTAIVRNNVDQRIPVYIQSLFLKIGVKMELQNMITTAVRARLNSREFEAIFSFTSTTTNRFAGHLRMFGEDAPSGYFNPDVAELLELAAKTLDTKTRDDLYIKIQQIMIQDFPSTFLLPFISTSIANCKIKGLSSPNRASPIGNLPSLWIEE